MAICLPGQLVLLRKILWKEDAHKLTHSHDWRLPDFFFDFTHPVRYPLPLGRLLQNFPPWCENKLEGEDIRFASQPTSCPTFIWNENLIYQLLDISSYTASGFSR